MYVWKLISYFSNKLDVSSPSCSSEEDNYEKSFYDIDKIALKKPFPMKLWESKVSFAYLVNYTLLFSLQI